MWPNLQFPADLVTFTEEFRNGKLHFLCSGSWIFQFSKPDNIWTYDIIKHLKTINFSAPPNFTWIIIAFFIFMQLADLGVYAMINFVHWQNKKYR